MSPEAPNQIWLFDYDMIDLMNNNWIIEIIPDLIPFSSLSSHWTSVSFSFFTDFQNINEFQDPPMQLKKQNI